MTIKQEIKWKWIKARWNVMDFLSKPMYKIARFFTNKDKENGRKKSSFLSYYSAIIYASIVEVKGKIAAESTEFVKEIGA